MKKIITHLWAYLFASPLFVNFNKMLLHVSLRGLGILNYSNKYLSGEINWLKKHFYDVENLVIFDVGANIGLYANSVLGYFPKATIYAFEPHPKNFLKLKSNSKLRALNQAVGDQEKKIQLYDYQEQDGSTHASIYKGAIEELRNQNSISYEVDMITLDTFCDKHQIREIDLLKIDIEGNELACLIGSNRLIEEGRIKAIQFEFNEMNILSHSNFKDFWDVLKDYYLYRILPGGKLLKIDRYLPIYCEIYVYQNIVAIRKVGT